MNIHSAFINEESHEKIEKENEEEKLKKELKRKRNRERQRAYYHRQKDLKKNEEKKKDPKTKVKTKVPKTNAERQREFRQRKAEKSYVAKKRRKLCTNEENVVQGRAVENIENATLQENQFHSQLHIYEQLQRNECITPEVILHRNTGIPGDVKSKEPVSYKPANSKEAKDTITEIQIKYEPDWDNSSIKEEECSIAEMLQAEMNVKAEPVDDMDIKEDSLSDDTEETMALLRCDLCQKHFPNPGEWVRHIQSTHTETEKSKEPVRFRTTEIQIKYEPDWDNSSIKEEKRSNAEMLQAEMNVKAEPVDDMDIKEDSLSDDTEETMALLRCDLCQKHFPNPGEWVRHIQSTHTETEKSKEPVSYKPANSKEAKDTITEIQIKYEPDWDNSTIEEEERSIAEMLQAEMNVKAEPVDDMDIKEDSLVEGARVVRRT